MIRRAVLEDTEALLELEQKCFDEENFALNRRAFKSNIIKNHLLVFEIDKNIVGYILVFLHKVSTKARIYSLAVKSDFRGQGIAKSLIEKAVVLAKEDGRNTIKLEVRCDNGRALKLYDKLGFEKVKTIRAYYLDGADAYVMEKKI